MEDLFREILVANSPSLPSTSLPLVDEVSELPETASFPSTSSSEMSSRLDREAASLLNGILAKGDAGGNAMNTGNMDVELNWANDDLQRLLDMLPTTAAEEGVCGAENIWDSLENLNATGSAVGVF